MKSSYLIPFLVLILMTINPGLSRVKSRGSKAITNKKPGSNIPKSSVTYKRGQLFFRGTYRAIHFNRTDESQVYASNYSMFPDGLYYRQPSPTSDYEEFLGTCVNTTLEQETNKEEIAKLQSEVYARVTLHIINFLCTENYKEHNNAGLCFSGLWVVTTVTAMLLVIETLD